MRYSNALSCGGRTWRKNDCGLNFFLDMITLRKDDTVIMRNNFEELQCLDETLLSDLMDGWNCCLQQKTK